MAQSRLIQELKDSYLASYPALFAATGRGQESHISLRVQHATRLGYRRHNLLCDAVASLTQKKRSETSATGFACAKCSGYRTILGRLCLPKIAIDASDGRRACPRSPDPRSRVDGESEQVGYLAVRVSNLC